MRLRTLKTLLLPESARRVLILRGPFRGARPFLKPRDSLRKIFGVYEHELNDWIERALKLVDSVIDVGANDGYFTFGCAAAFQRLSKPARIIAFEPQADHYTTLKLSEENRQARGAGNIQIEILRQFIGCTVADSRTTLDFLTMQPDNPMTPRKTLIKIDVEGAEIDVIEGASLWLNESNLFMIEVHGDAHLDVLKSRFMKNGFRLRTIRQEPLPLIGREWRQLDNCWLVSHLD